MRYGFFCFFFFLWGGRGRNNRIKFSTLRIWKDDFEIFFLSASGLYLFPFCCVFFSQKLSSHTASKLLVLTISRLCWWSWFSMEYLQFCVITVGVGGRKMRERWYRYIVVLKLRSNIVSSQSSKKSHSCLERPRFGPHIILRCTQFTGTRGRKI